MGKWIVAPLYRSLFWKSSGWCTKWFSPFAEQVFAMHPIFVGTGKELIRLIGVMDKARLQDPLHKNDVLWPNRAKWFV